MNLLDKSIRTQFASYFPNPEVLKKRMRPKNVEEPPRDENPYRSVITWFDKGNTLNLFLNIRDEDKVKQLLKVDGLQSLVKKHFKGANDKESALLMEFVLHGLSSYSMISKKVIEGRIEFKDLMGSMLNLGSSKSHEDDFDGE